MFLAELNEVERKYFLDLAHLAMKSSGEIKPEEQEIYNSYAYECMLEDYECSDKSLDVIAQDLKDSKMNIKRIILIELMGIWAADNSWHDGELEMMYKLGEIFEIPEKNVNRLKRWTKELRELIVEGYELIEQGG